MSRRGLLLALALGACTTTPSANDAAPDAKRATPGLDLFAMFGSGLPSSRRPAKTPEEMQALMREIRPPAQEPIEVEVPDERLYGRWKLVGQHMQGKDFPLMFEDEYEFAPGQFWLITGPKRSLFTLRVDSGSYPGRYDFYLNENGPDFLATGLYAIHEKTLCIVYSLPGRPRPKRLTAGPGEPHLLQTLTRVSGPRDE